MSSLAVVAIIAGVISLGCWVASLVTGDTSWVDRIWSIAPVIYLWVFAAYSHFDVRVTVMAVLVTAWGIRLTFNFARRGGYTGTEDYRWAVLRSRMSKWQFWLFNLFFIVIYQNLLLVLITLQLDAEVYRPGLKVEVHRRDGQVKRVRIGAVVAHAGDRLRAAITDDLTPHSPTPGPMVALSAVAQMHELAPDSDGAEELQWQAPRAWRRRTPISAQQWRILNDTGGEDRSAAATAAAWVLWDVGFRSFAAVRWFYAHCPAFAKFRDRDGDRRRARSACAAHWQSITARASTHRPPLDPADQALVDDALAEIATWDEPDLVAAAVAVITHRFTDGHGLVDRPIAKRCLATWMSVCDSRAYVHLQRLQERGLLVRTRDWQDGPANEAALYSLRVPDELYRGNGDHDVTVPLWLHPLWGQLGHLAYTLWSLLATQERAVTTSEVAGKSPLPPGGTGWGVLGLLNTLGSLGLVTRIGTGKGTRWTVVPAQADKGAVDSAATSIGAFERAKQLRARIVGERKAYHAEGPGERARMRSGLKVLRDRLTHTDIAGREQGSLFVTVATEMPGRSDYRWAGARPAPPPETATPDS